MRKQACRLEDAARECVAHRDDDLYPALATRLTLGKQRATLFARTCSYIFIATSTVHTVNVSFSA